MKTKLPVKTIKLRKQTKPVLYGSLIVFLLTAAGLFTLALKQEFGDGKLVLLLLSIFLMFVSLFTLLAIIRLTREHYIGMFISEEGLNDISTGHTYGMVRWKDVTTIHEVEQIENPKQKYIILQVHNPQEYIDREPSPPKKRSMTLKFHQYGSPICLSSRALACTFDELDEMLHTYFNVYLTNKKEKAVKNT